VESDKKYWQPRASIHISPFWRNFRREIAAKALPA
jgi:hypothetical protein